MEICFVPDRDYGKFLRDARLAEVHQGEVVDTAGKKLGEHEGIEFYTIGQRRGLGISSSQPLYVVELDAVNNRVIVGDDTQLNRDAFQIANCNWIAPERMSEATGAFECTARIRYNHPGAAAVVTPGFSGTASVKLHEPARAVTPGQACVLYDGDRVLGGGWITR